MRAIVSTFVASMALVACVQTVDSAGKPGRAGRAGAADQEEPGYTVDVELSPQATRGQESLARVRVRPKSPWHMNLDYPAKLNLEAPADVGLQSPHLTKLDAERFDDGALVFSVLFTPQEKGSRTIQAELDFAVCGAAACGSVTESVELAFEVGCREEDSGLC